MLRPLLLLAAAFTLLPPAFSQYGYSPTNVNSGMYQKRTWDRMNERTLMRAVLRAHGYTDEHFAKMTLDEFYAAYEKVKNKQAPAQPTPPPKPARPAKPAAAPATRYAPSGQRLVLDSVVKALATDKEQEDALRQLFTAGLKAIEDAAKEAEMPNDLAFAMAFFVGTAYSLEGEEVEDKVLLAFADSVQVIFDTPEMRKTPNAEKQKFAEFLMIMGTFLMASKENLDPQTDTETLNGLKATARDVLKKYLGLDPALYKLTENGLAKR